MNDFLQFEIEKIIKLQGNMQILNQGPFTQNFGMQEEKERKVLGNFFTPKITPPKVKKLKTGQKTNFLGHPVAISSYLSLSSWPSLLCNL